VVVVVVDLLWEASLFQCFDTVCWVPGIDFGKPGVTETDIYSSVSGGRSSTGSRSRNRSVGGVGGYSSSSNV